jgi:hypothetical protein
VIKRLVIRENPICQVSSFILRNYTLAALPALTRFNEADVTPAERAIAVKTFQLLLFSSGRKNKASAAKFDQVANKCCVGSLGAEASLPAAASGRSKEEGGEGASNLTGRGPSPTNTPMQRKDLELKYPYKSQQSSAGVGAGPAGAGTSTLVSVTAADMVQMAVRARKAELRFQKVLHTRLILTHLTSWWLLQLFDVTVDAIVLEAVESLQGVPSSKASHKKGRNKTSH